MQRSLLSSILALPLSTLIPSILLVALATWLLFSPIILPIPNNLSHLRNKKILLLTAHPDDESMFFAPTLQALARSELGNHVKLLCLSAGEGDGDAAVRTHEIAVASKMLGLRSEDDVLVLGPERATSGGSQQYIFRDGLGISWPAEEVAKILREGFLTDASGQTPTKARKASVQQPQPTIDILLTFDTNGVSGHSNHASCHSGAKKFWQEVTAHQATEKSPALQLYTLHSVSILRKYISFLDIPFTLLAGAIQVVSPAVSRSLPSILASPPRNRIRTGLKAREETTQKGAAAAPPSPLVFISDYPSYRQAQRAMVDGHRSQMRWFRWGWIGIGRYMIVNDLRRETV